MLKIPNIQRCKGSILNNINLSNILINNHSVINILSIKKYRRYFNPVMTGLMQ